MMLTINIDGSGAENIPNPQRKPSALLFPKTKLIWQETKQKGGNSTQVSFTHCGYARGPGQSCRYPESPFEALASFLWAGSPALEVENSGEGSSSQEGSLRSQMWMAGLEREQSNWG